MEPNELDADRPIVAIRERTALVVGTALLVAGLILVIAVLPAEFGVDPLGIGRKLGLTAMYDVQTSLATFQATSAGAPSGTIIVALASSGLSSESRRILPRGASARERR